MKIVRLSLVAALFVIPFCGSAWADSVTLSATFPGSGDNASTGAVAPLNVTINSNYDTGGYYSNTQHAATAAGVYTFSLTLTPGSLNLTVNNTNLSPSAAKEVYAALSGALTFNAVCIDFTHNVNWNGGPYSFTVQNLTTLQGATQFNGVGINAKVADAIGFLWKTYYQNLGSIGSDFSGNIHYDYAAFQLAIWDVIYNGGVYSSPTFTPSTSLTTYAPVGGTVPYVYYTGDAATALDGRVAGETVTGLAEFWALTAANAANNDSTNVKYTNDVYAIVNTNIDPTNQSFSFAFFDTSSSNVAPVPLPGAGGLGFGMLTGFGSLFAFRRYFRRGKISIVT